MIAPILVGLLIFGVAVLGVALVACTRALQVSQEALERRNEVIAHFWDGEEEDE